VESAPLLVTALSNEKQLKDDNAPNTLVLDRPIALPLCLNPHRPLRPQTQHIPA
jgi:hypothetical protein